MKIYQSYSQNMQIQQEMLTYNATTNTMKQVEVCLYANFNEVN
jgi:hypothetical protein